MKFENDWHRVAQEQMDANEALRRRLQAFEEKRDPGEFPVDFEGWHYDGHKFVLAPHATPAYSDEQVVICELNGPPETRARHARLICEARAALYWWLQEADASHLAWTQMEELQAKNARLKAQLADLQLLLAQFPPDLIPILEKLLEKIGFHFNPDRHTMNCLNETQAIIDQFKLSRRAASWIERKNDAKPTL